MSALPTDAFPTLFATSRLRLQRPRWADRVMHARQMMEAHLLRARPLPDDRARKFAAFMIGHCEHYEFGVLVIERVDELSGALSIGHVGFKYTDAWPEHWAESFDSIERGFSIVPAARGRGYVTDSARAAL